jgi:hypothetical protein
MLHRGFYRGTSELGRLLISPIPAISVPPLPLEETEIPITRQWFLRALVYFVGWLVFFALLVLLGVYIPHATPTFLEY